MTVESFCVCSFHFLVIKGFSSLFVLDWPTFLVWILTFLRLPIPRKQPTACDSSFRALTYEPKNIFPVIIILVALGPNTFDLINKSINPASPYRLPRIFQKISGF